MSLTSREIRLMGARLIVPRSTATNAYDLLMDVAAVIEEEPRRYNQEDWLVRVEPSEVYEGKVESGPSCGTVGCRAGWIVELAGAWDKDADKDPIVTWFGGGVAGAARRILGVNWGRSPGEEYAREMQFDMAITRLFDGAALSGRDLRIGTPEYAAAGAAGVREFAETWKERLLATAVATNR